MGGDADPGRDAAAGCRCEVPGPADRACAGGLRTEPVLCAHDVHEGAGGGHPHRDSRVAAAAPARGGHRGLQGLRGDDARDARLPRGLHREHFRGHAVSQRVPTLGQLWAREQQVLVSYEDEATVSRHDELWPAIPYWWGNAVKTDVLLQFLETKKGHGRPGGLFVAGINVTENLCYVLLHPGDSLEEMTRRSVPLTTQWVRAQQPGQRPHCTNIIAGDFVGADGFVSDVISLNQKLVSP
ncbi:PI-PLC X domain-containing protein 1 isoform X1 [Rattus norvegicus]|uniref:PI-PLC X domain-containing protein 1 isoform X1 n=1 Tax=Rattus norvegicus TaxID=10116 RepID=UPI002FD7C7D5